MAHFDRYLPKMAQEFLSTRRGSFCGTQVRQFHIYIEHYKTEISEIDPGTVFGFLEQKTLLDRTRHVYKCQLLAYLDFLFECGQIGFDPDLLRIKPISNVKPIPEQARAFIESSKGNSAAVAAVRNFHQWLNDNELELQNLSPTIFSVHLEGRLKSVAPSTGTVYRLQLLAYLEFQYQANHINFDPATLRDKPKESPIPENCRLILENKSPSMTSIARVFHVWLNSKNLTPADLTVIHFKEFHDSRLENLSELTVRNSENILLRYLDLLHSKNLVGFDPVSLHKPPRTIALPEQAKTFLAHHGIVSKDTTLKFYTSSLRSFYKWLDISQRELSNLTAFDLEEFALYLKSRDLKAITRNGRLVCLRVYLRWLNEHGLLDEDAENLIKPETFPKLPRYLPRPYPQEVDTAIQDRLSKSKDQYSQGLLLMRNTGLRISELTNLEFNCLQYSHDNQHFLKVPQGKLNTERLVPIDDVTLKIIKTLQGDRPRSSTTLLETVRGVKTRKDCYSKALKSACKGLDLHGPAHTHRLRHTFATSMLNGGMSIVGLMKILGHNDHRMTLRYSAITTETVRDEYMTALEKLASRYKGIVADELKMPHDPLKSIRDIAKRIQLHSSKDPAIEKKKSAIVKRLHRIEDDLKILASTCNLYL
ncbi:MAG: tyrosine-type recombinase/integrase [Proteobacteria bacterium]|nr:tyrosine-type recombinase/integrase [Pseudomonadota bacterium]